MVVIALLFVVGSIGFFVDGESSSPYLGDPLPMIIVVVETEIFLVCFYVVIINLLASMFNCSFW